MTKLTVLPKLTQDCCCADLLEELETLVEQLDQQEAAKQQAFRRAEAAEKELEAIKADRPQTAVVSALPCLFCPCTMQLIGVGLTSYLLYVLLQRLSSVMTKLASSGRLLYDGLSSDCAFVH